MRYKYWINSEHLVNIAKLDGKYNNVKPGNFHFENETSRSPYMGSSCVLFAVLTQYVCMLLYFVYILCIQVCACLYSCVYSDWVASLYESPFYLSQSVWVTICGSQCVGHNVWVTMCGSQCVGHNVWVIMCWSQCVGHFVLVQMCHDFIIFVIFGKYDKAHNDTNA